MLSMTEIKIKEEVKAMERELLEVGRMIVEEEAIRREKIAGCNAAREMHEAQVSAILLFLVWTGLVQVPKSSRPERPPTKMIAKTTITGQYLRYLQTGEVHHGRGGRAEPSDPDSGDEEREAGGQN